MIIVNQKSLSDKCYPMEVTFSNGNKRIVRSYKEEEMLVRLLNKRNEKD